MSGGINVSTSRKAIKSTIKEGQPLDLPATLDSLRDMLQGRQHPKSGLKFGGSLLAPHVKAADIENVIKPAHDKMLQLGGSARDHPVSDKLLAFQQQLVDSNPQLKQTIAALHVNKNIEKIPSNPFEHMNDQQLYHHVMGMEPKDWAKVQETAGVLARKTRSRLGGSLAKGQLHDLIREHVPKFHDLVLPIGGSVSSGGGLDFNEDKYMDKLSHLMDISMSRVPKIAAERLEREHEGGSFSSVLKNALWTSAVQDLKKRQVVSV